MPPVDLDFSLRVERSEQLLHSAWRERGSDRVERSFIEGPHELDVDPARRLTEALRTATGFPPVRPSRRTLPPRPRGDSPRARCASTPHR